MKTAISIPDPLFVQADEAADRLGLSRSQLYAAALEQFLAAEPEDEVTRRLNEIYAFEPSALDRDIAAAQARAISDGDDDW